MEEKPMNICVYGASSDLINKDYILAGERLGEEMAKRGHSLIFGGGARGLMGAVARGTTKGGGKITGIAPSFFNVDGILYEKCDEFIHTETMRERKQLMEDMADAFVMTPGGIGTYEEFFEILTLKQLTRHKKAIAILNTKGYFDSLLALLSKTVDESFMSPKSIKLFEVFDNEKELLDYLDSYVPEEISITDTKYIK